MSKSRKEFFVRIPKPFTGTRKQHESVTYVATDETRFSLSDATLYERGRDKRGKQVYHPAIGAMQYTKELWSDYTDTVDTLHDMVSQVERAVETFGPQGEEIVARVVAPFRQLEHVIRALEKGYEGTAVDEVQAVFYDLMSSLADIAERWQTAEEHLSGQLIATDMLEGHIAEVDEVNDAVYHAWGDSVLAIVDAVSHLRAHERRLRDLQHSVQRIADDVSGILGSDTDELQRALAFIDGEDESFLMRVYRVLTEGVALTDAHREDAQTALQHCAQIDTVIANATAAWTTQTSDLLHEALGIRQDVIRRRGLLEKAITSFRIAEGTYKNPLKPYEAKSTRELISKEEYDRAQAVVRDGRWRDRACAERFDALIGRVLDEPQPTIAPEVEELCARAREDAERVLCALGDSTIMRVVPPTEVPLPAVVHNTSTTAKPMASTKTTIVTNEDSLYELVMCVASVVIGADRNPIRQSNPRALLQVVEELGFCSDADVKEYAKRVGARMRMRDNCERCTQAALGMRWEKSRKPWLMYDVVRNSDGKVRRPNVTKMSVHGVKLAQPLLAKYALTPERIRAAKKSLGERKDAAYAARKTKEQSNGPSS
jgi:hypothetical protein